MAFSDKTFVNMETPIPQEIWNYYKEHYEQEFNRIPLNAETAQKIAKILDECGC